MFFYERNVLLVALSNLKNPKPTTTDHNCKNKVNNKNNIKNYSNNNTYTY